MATDLTGLQVRNTYNSLLKIGDNTSLTGIAKRISDGLGNDSPLFISTSQISIGVAPATGYDLTVNSGIRTGSIDVLGAATAQSLQFTGGGGTQGTMSWNTDEETVDLIQNGATLQLGQETHVHVKNQSGATINDGTPVYVTGTLGASGRLTVAPMIADGSIEAKYFLGVTTEDIPNGEDGKVTTFGKIRGLNTSAYAPGTTLYVSSTTAGFWQTTPPVSPALDLEVAIVINQHANNGTLFVRAQNGQYLGLLHDVYLNSVADNQLLVYNATNSRWENQGIASIGAINLDTVTDNGNTTTNNISVGDINAGNVTLTGYLRGAANFVIDPAAHGDETGVVQILGDLRVDGTTTTINSTTVTIDDKNIVLASGSATAADANGAGLTIDGANATITYNSTSDRFVFNKDIRVPYLVASSSEPQYNAITLATTGDTYVYQDFQTDSIGALKAYLIAYGSASNDDGAFAIKNTASHTTTNGTSGDIFFQNRSSETLRLYADNTSEFFGDVTGVKFIGNIETGSITGTTIDINASTAINLKYNGSTQMRIDTFGVTYLGTVLFNNDGISLTDEDSTTDSFFHANVDYDAGLYSVTSNARYGSDYIQVDGLDSRDYTKFTIAPKDIGSPDPFAYLYLGGDNSITAPNTLVDWHTIYMNALSVRINNNEVATRNWSSLQNVTGIGNTTTNSIAIGQTTAPSQALHVNGNIIVGGQDNGFVHGGGRLAVSADGDVIIVTDSNDTAGATPDGKIVFGGGSLVDTNADQSFSFSDAFDEGLPRNEWARLIEGKMGIGETDPDTKLHITEEGAAPVLLTLQNTQASGDILNDGTTGNFIDFVSTDANANFTPQVRIGMVVQDYDADNGVISEGVGNFVVYTGQGTDSLGNGTLTETFRVREDNGIQINGTTNNLIFSEIADGTWHLRDTFQDNGIKIYSSTNGLEFIYNGDVKMTIDGNGVNFDSDISINQANMDFNDSGITFNISQTATGARGLVWSWDGDQDGTASQYAYIRSGGTVEGEKIQFNANGEGTITGSDILYEFQNAGTDVFLVGADGTITAKRLRLTATDDASLSSTLHGLQIGDTSNINLIIDINEILVRNNGANETLYLQNNGGLTSVGGNLTVAGTITGNGSGLTAVNATTLDNLDSTAFLRSNTADTFTGGTLTISSTAPILDFVDTNSFSDANDRFRIRAAGDVGQIRWYDSSAATDLVLATFYPDGDFGVAGNISLNGGKITIVQDAGDRPSLAFQETLGTDSFIIEYNGVGSGDGNYVSFYSQVSGWAGLGQGLNYIPANGRVGIGTSSPTQALDVIGNGRFVNSGSSLVRVETSNSGSYRLDLYANYSYANPVDLQGYAGYSFLKTIDGGNAVALYTLNNPRLFINSSGNVGMGTTSPAARLHLETTDSSARPLRVGTSLAGSSYVAIDMYTDSIAQQDLYLIAYGSGNAQDGSFAIKNNASHTTTNGTAGDIWFASGASSTEKMRIKESNGYVGVGTDSPTARLHSYHPTTNVVARFESGDAVAYIDLHDSNSSGSYGVLLGAVGNDFVISPSSNEKVRVTNAGYVGIGTDTPLDMLHLKSTGDVQIRLEADTDNVGEDDNPSILLVQDGGAVSARLNLSADNNLELINQYDGAVHIGQNNSPNFTIDNTGKFAFGSALSTASHFMHVYAETPFLCLTNTLETFHGIRFEDAQATTSQYSLFGYNCSTNHVELHINGTKRFQFNSDGAFHADNDITAFSSSVSDQRLKDDIETIDNALEKVKALRGVQYVWNKGSRKGQKDLGVVAQEVESVLPEIVREKEMPLLDDSGEKYKTVDYEKMVGVLIEAIKEQQKQIDELKARLDA